MSERPFRFSSSFIDAAIASPEPNIRASAEKLTSELLFTKKTPVTRVLLAVSTIDQFFSERLTVWEKRVLLVYGLSLQKDVDTALLAPIFGVSGRIIDGIVEEVSDEENKNHEDIRYILHRLVLPVTKETNPRGYAIFAAVKEAMSRHGKDVGKVQAEVAKTIPQVTTFDIQIFQERAIIDALLAPTLESQLEELEKLNLTVGQRYTRLRRFGYSDEELSAARATTLDELEGEILLLWQQGLRRQEICDILKLDKTTYARLYMRLRRTEAIERRPRIGEVGPEERVEIKRLLNSGVRNAELIGFLCQVPANQVKKIRRQLIDRGETIRAKEAAYPETKAKEAAIVALTKESYWEDPSVLQGISAHFFTAYRHLFKTLEEVVVEDAGFQYRGYIPNFVAWLETSDIPYASVINGPTRPSGNRVIAVPRQFACEAGAMMNSDQSLSGLPRMERKSEEKELMSA